MGIGEALKAQLLAYQRNEITEHQIYQRPAETVEEPETARILADVAGDELRHYGEWKVYTGQEVARDRFRALKYYWIRRVFGFTFGVKRMERGEEGARVNYQALAERIPEAERIAADEHKHEDALIELLDEEGLRYAGSIVLGLNDALVELAGALAGLSFVAGFLVRTVLGVDV